MDDDQYLVLITRIDTKLTTVSDDIAELKHSMFGNGQPGIRQKVIELETTVRVLKWSTMLAVSVGGVVTTILGYLLIK